MSEEYYMVPVNVKYQKDGDFLESFFYLGANLVESISVATMPTKTT